jgi:hypothetical protein
LQYVNDTSLTRFLTRISDLDRVQNDTEFGNSPLVFGGKRLDHHSVERATLTRFDTEWALSTQFQADDAFLQKWADAQKLAYSKGAGWIVSFRSSHVFCFTLNTVSLIVLELQD